MGRFLQPDSEPYLEKAENAYPRTVTAILLLSVTKVKKGDDTMVKKWQITIPELTGDITRNAYVYLPESYDREPERR